MDGQDAGSEPKQELVQLGLRKGIGPKPRLIDSQLLPIFLTASSLCAQPSVPQFPVMVTPGILT